ncbi:LYR motif-containing protein 4 isoform X1 [Macaca thibetana thibetana]|uniref:LYR motif-containing protein 4 isoform X1 n=1 Tax=Macaca thibetana thibetana TaxID=257877 RepID=UPI0021BC98CA|nr:LYR motif-containing protein 4 isoform X1 [Macaca thibetana thibetana]
MAASSRAQVLDLYRAMLRESKRFSSYNYRTYAVRRIRDAFRENKNVKDPVEIQTLVNKAKRDLEVIRRQMTRCSCLFAFSCTATLSSYYPCHGPSGYLCARADRRPSNGMENRTPQMDRGAVLGDRVLLFNTCCSNNMIAFCPGPSLRNRALRSTLANCIQLTS